jgi:hypothetical protein
MFKPITISADAVRAGSTGSAEPDSAVSNVFRVLHGFYGNLFLGKFSNGQTNAQGEDTGVLGAKGIWTHGLRAFDVGVIKAALARVIDDHPEFPPNLPQFVAICKAIQPRKVAPESQPRLGMDSALQAEYSARARAEAMAAYQRRIDAEKRATDGLPMLQQLVAQAVALAGGDEVATLRRLDAEAIRTRRAA